MAMRPMRQAFTAPAKAKRNRTDLKSLLSTHGLIPKNFGAVAPVPSDRRANSGGRSAFDSRSVQRRDREVVSAMIQIAQHIGEHSHRRNADLGRQRVCAGSVVDVVASKVGERSAIRIQSRRSPGDRHRGGR